MTSSAPSSVPLTNGHDYTITFTLIGTSLTCQISGDINLTLNTTDTSHTSGFAGFGLFNNGAEAQATADNFRIEAL